MGGCEYIFRMGGIYFVDRARIEANDTFQKGLHQYKLTL
jgi:hypothetical protein